MVGIGIASFLTGNHTNKRPAGRKVLFVEASRCCVAWMEKAVEHAGYGEGTKSETVRMYKSALENLRTGSATVSARTLALVKNTRYLHIWI